MTKGLKKVQLEKKLEVKIKVRTKILGKNERATFMIIWPIMLSLWKVPKGFVKWSRRNFKKLLKEWMNENLSNVSMFLSYRLANWGHQLVYQWLPRLGHTSSVGNFKPCRVSMRASEFPTIFWQIKFGPFFRSVLQS